MKHFPKIIFFLAVVLLISIGIWGRNGHGHNGGQAAIVLGFALSAASANRRPCRLPRFGALHSFFR